jgi:hypothetical protein
MSQVQCFRIFALFDPDSESGSTDLIESGSTDLIESGSNLDPKHWSIRYGMVGKYYHSSYTYVNFHFTVK